MTINNKSKINVIHIFVFIEFVIYLCFLYIDITGKYMSISNVLKYLSILICSFFTILPVNKSYDPRKVSKYDQRDIILLRLALIFTLISDYFLLFNYDYMYGLITFSIVQSLYLVRIYRWRCLGFKSTNSNRYKLNVAIEESKRINKGFGDNKKPPIYLYFIRNITLTALVLLIISLVLAVNILAILQVDIAYELKIFSDLDLEIKFIIILALFYFISLLFNLVDSFVVSKNSKTIQAKVFCLGLFLFMLCDINVGIFNITNYLTIYSRDYNLINTISLNSIWLFYLPSQVLISLSKYSIMEI